MSLDRVFKDLQDGLKGASDELAVDLYNRLWSATPVRTGTPGAAGELETEEDGSLRISNDADYLQFLNNGSSEQAPAGFIQKAMAETLAQDFDPGGGRAGHGARNRGVRQRREGRSPAGAVLMSLLSHLGRRVYMGPHERVKSSNVRSIAYDAYNKVMQVKFKNGGTYNYYGVPLEAYDSVHRGRVRRKEAQHRHQGRLRLRAGVIN